MTERPTYPKSGCCVPFCRRTSRRFKDEWICGDHWKLVPRALKRFRTKRLKALRLEYERFDGQLSAIHAGSGRGREYWMILDNRDRAGRVWGRVERSTWRRMKRIAIEKATGL